MTTHIDSRISRLTAWLPPAIWMALIAWFSTDQWSAEHTGPVIGSIVEWLFPWLTTAQVAIAHTIARKSAHFTEYAILALLWFRAFVRGQQWPPARAGWTALIISVAWAALDETHQIFVASREASVIDATIDATGAACALWWIGPRTD